ncbi:MAG TPA: hypothetical protein VGR50_08210 [Terriglobales bacterium]|nr:hypothetical protein [Terriglobales bacterium]
MSAHNNLGPRHLPKWPTGVLVVGLTVAAGFIEEHFEVRAGWFAVTEYIAMLFGAIVLSFRPAWGRRKFWSTLGVLFGLHALVGLLLLLVVPGWLHALGSFLTVIFVSDSLLTMAILWRVTAAKRGGWPTHRASTKA